MIYVRLAGGLGNQLFQVLHAISISKNGEKIIILTNSLNKFKTSRCVEYISLIDHDSLQIISRPSIFTRIFISRLRLGKFLHMFDKKFDLISFFLGLMGIDLPKIVDGYFQEPSMLEINHFFNSVTIKIPSTNTYYENFASSFDCCLHLRGGDFLFPENASLNICDFDYYSSAVRSAFSDGYKTFLVFGNDYHYSILLRDRLREQFPFCKFAVHNKDFSAIQDFDVMTRFEAFVLSNSTFCWWAARFACLYKDNVSIYGPSFFEMNREYPRFPCRHVAVSLKSRKDR